MGTNRDDFLKYPRTPHLFGSKGTDDDKHLGREESELANPSLIVEEKLDGTNVGIHSSWPFSKTRFIESRQLRHRFVHKLGTIIQRHVIRTFHYVHVSTSRRSSICW